MARKSTGRGSHHDRDVRAEIKGVWPEILLRYGGGEPIISIAESLGVASLTVRRRLASDGIAIRGRRDALALSATKWSHAKRQESIRKAIEAKRAETDSRIPNIREICRLYVAGESENSLSLKFGVSRNAIRLRLIDAGVKIRSQPEANRLMMSGRSKSENMRNSKSAHDAMRGSKVPFDVQCAKAKTRQERGRGVSKAETIMRIWLLERGVDSIPQLAVGPYNVDLGSGPVAVEIFGGGWHLHGRHSRRIDKRTRYLLNAGWNLMVVWVDGRRWPLSAAAADYVAAFVKKSRSNPAFRGEYRVILGSGEAPAGKMKLDHFSIKPTIG